MTRAGDLGLECGEYGVGSERRQQVLFWEAASLPQRTSEVLREG